MQNKNINRKFAELKKCLFAIFLKKGTEFSVACCGATKKQRSESNCHLLCDLVRKEREKMRRRTARCYGVDLFVFVSGNP